MKTGKSWSTWKARGAWLMLALPLLAHVTGCAKDRASVEKSLLAQQSSQPRNEVAQRYRVACPDVLELVVAERPEFNGKHPIGTDGRIGLGEYGDLRVEGRTPVEVAKLVADETGVEMGSVQVRVLEYRSQHILLFGEVIGWQRSVPYHGQETVVDLLQRVGGITPGAEPRDVYVVRPHLGENRRPEVFRVDLHSIVLKQDPRTNIRVLPFDQVYVGETRQSQVEKAIPPWLRRLYQAAWDTRPSKAAAKD